MNTILLQGLKIRTTCTYVKIGIGEFLDARSSSDGSTYEITIPNTKFNNKYVVDSCITQIEECELTPTDYIKIHNPVININNCIVKKITQDIINYNQFIVSDIDKFIVSVKDNRVVILIPEKLLNRVDLYRKCIESIDYFDIVEIKTEKFVNIYNINLADKSTIINSQNTIKFSTKSKYDNYTLRMIDVMESFITKFEKLVGSYEIQLFALPIDEKLDRSNYISYEIINLGAQVSYKSDDNLLKYAVRHTSSINFEFSTSNFIMFNDIKNRYQNLDFITDFTEFYTEDKLGNNWISSINWSTISSEFSQSYDNDDKLGGFAYKFSFSCDLYYFIVFNNTMSKIASIATNLINNNDDNIKFITE